MLRPLLIHQHPQRPSSVSSVLGDSTPPSTLLAIFVALEPTPPSPSHAAFGSRELGKCLSQRSRLVAGGWCVCSNLCEKLNLILPFAVNYVLALSYLVQFKGQRSSRVPGASGGELTVLLQTFLLATTSGNDIPENSHVNFCIST